MKPTIFYKKGLTEPHSYRGLHIINPNFGWVEYLQQNNKSVHYARGISPALYQQWSDISYKRLIDAFIHGDSYFIGLLKHLTQIRAETPFTMPLFATTGSLPSSARLSCGSTRFMAELINQTNPDKIPVVFQLGAREYLPPDVVTELSKSTESA